MTVFLDIKPNKKILRFSIDEKIEKIMKKIGNDVKEQIIEDEMMVHLMEQENEIETVERQRQLGSNYVTNDINRDSFDPSCLCRKQCTKKPKK